MARHEHAKHAFGTALGTLECMQVRLEPLVSGTQRSNGIGITGSASSVFSSEDINITIVSLAAQDSQTATLPTTEGDSAAEEPPNLSSNTSTLWQGRNDADTHLRTDHSGLPFSPSAAQWKQTLETLPRFGNRS